MVRQESIARQQLLAVKQKQKEAELEAAKRQVAEVSGREGGRTS
jgi:hypothetical protein